MKETIWLVIVHLFIAAICIPIFKKSAKEEFEEEGLESYLNSNEVAVIAAFIPLYNLYMLTGIVVSMFKARKAAALLDKTADKIEDKEAREELKRIAKEIRDKAKFSELW